MKNRRAQTCSAFMAALLLITAAPIAANAAGVDRASSKKGSLLALDGGRYQYDFNAFDSTPGVGTDGKGKISATRFEPDGKKSGVTFTADVLCVTVEGNVGTVVGKVTYWEGAPTATGVVFHIYDSGTATIPDGVDIAATYETSDDLTVQAYCSNVAYVGPNPNVGGDFVLEDGA